MPLKDADDDDQESTTSKKRKSTGETSAVKKRKPTPARRRVSQRDEEFISQQDAVGSSPSHGRQRTQNKISDHFQALADDTPRPGGSQFEDDRLDTADHDTDDEGYNISPAGIDHFEDVVDDTPIKPAAQNPVNNIAPTSKNVESAYSDDAENLLPPQPVASSFSDVLYKQAFRSPAKSFAWSHQAFSPLPKRASPVKSRTAAKRLSNLRFSISGISSADPLPEASADPTSQDVGRDAAMWKSMIAAPDSDNLSELSPGPDVQSDDGGDTDVEDMGGLTTVIPGEDTMAQSEEFSIVSLHSLMTAKDHETSFAESVIASTAARQGQESTPRPEPATRLQRASTSELGTPTPTKPSYSSPGEVPSRRKSTTSSARQPQQLKSAEKPQKSPSPFTFRRLTSSRTKSQRQTPKQEKDVVSTDDSPSKPTRIMSRSTPARLSASQSPRHARNSLVKDSPHTQMSTPHQSPGTTRLLTPNSGDKRPDTTHVTPSRTQVVPGRGLMSARSPSFAATSKRSYSETSVLDEEPPTIPEGYSPASAVPPRHVTSPPKGQDRSYLELKRKRDLERQQERLEAARLMRNASSNNTILIEDEEQFEDEEDDSNGDQAAPDGIVDDSVDSEATDGGEAQQPAEDVIGASEDFEELNDRETPQKTIGEISPSMAFEEEVDEIVRRVDDDEELLKENTGDNADLWEEEASRLSAMDRPRRRMRPAYASKSAAIQSSITLQRQMNTTEPTYTEDDSQSTPPAKSIIEPLDKSSTQQKSKSQTGRMSNDTPMRREKLATDIDAIFKNIARNDPDAERRYDFAESPSETESDLNKIKSVPSGVFKAPPRPLFRDIRGSRPTQERMPVSKRKREPEDAEASADGFKHFASSEVLLAGDLSVASDVHQLQSELRASIESPDVSFRRYQKRPRYEPEVASQRDPSESEDENADDVNEEGDVDDESEPDDMDVEEDVVASSLADYSALSHSSSSMLQLNPPEQKTYKPLFSPAPIRKTTLSYNRDPPPRPSPRRVHFSPVPVVRPSGLPTSPEQKSVLSTLWSYVPFAGAPTPDPTHPTHRLLRHLPLLPKVEPWTRTHYRVLDSMYQHYKAYPADFSKGHPSNFGLISPEISRFVDIQFVNWGYGVRLSSSLIVLARLYQRLLLLDDIAHYERVSGFRIDVGQCRPGKTGTPLQWWDVLVRLFTVAAGEMSREDERNGVPINRTRGMLRWKFAGDEDWTWWKRAKT